ncbi:MAG TPA: hypothetical protein PKE06_14625 [Flavilitoribacter sp.]|nr:hypothetical protein [Flavilitoribacter sp.]HMQ89229.1 hypothetical protein [Flavilitoribacter sp.]
MKKLPILFTVLLFLAVSGCNKTTETVAPVLEGQYTGTFERNGTIAPVELNLNDQDFTGSSETDKFPAICSGHYTATGDSISFENTCIWTAEFDWTLILSESWHYVVDNNKLTLIRPNGDRYDLQKQ